MIKPARERRCKTDPPGVLNSGTLSQTLSALQETFASPSLRGLGCLSLEHLQYGLDGGAVPARSEAGNDCRGHRRHIGVVVHLLAAMDVGDVDLNDRTWKHLERIHDRHGRERIGCRIDNDPAAGVDGL